jgi:CheY-like chemotaxis protein
LMDVDSADAGVEDVAGQMAHGKGVVFVGAGASASAGAPTWSDLVEPLRKRLKPPTAETSPQLIAQFFRNQAGDHELFSYLRQALGHLRPSPVHEAICGLPLHAFVTTNYDNLLETAFRNTGRKVHAITDEHEIGLWNESDEAQLLKLHGDIDSSRSIVLTEQDYFRSMHERPAFRRKVVELFCHRTVLFVGFSMRDPNVANFYNLAVHELGGVKRTAYILTPETDRHLRRHWATLGLQSIHLPGTAPAELSASLVQFLASLRAELDRGLRGCDVLIVEDDPDVRDVISDVLTDHGVRVQTAANGHHGLLLAGKLRPRVIILDLMMPVMDGMKMLSLMRADPDLHTTHVVVVSALGGAQEAVAGLGVEDVLRKPFDMETLLDAVRKSLTTSHRRLP